MSEAVFKRYAASKQIPLGVAEKDYVLSVVIMHLSKSQHANKLIFKGGTAIKKVYYPDARFSVDLDFDFFDVAAKDLVTDISRMFTAKSILEVNFIEVNEHKMANNKALLRLRYTAQLNHVDNVRLDFASQEPLLTTPEWWTPTDEHDVARRMSCEHLIVGGGEYAKHYSCKLGRMSRHDNRRLCLDCRMEAPRRGNPAPSTFRVMSREEILSEKVRACLTRARPRDLYDISFLRSKGIKLDRKMILSKLRLYNEFEDSPPNLAQIKEWLSPMEAEWDRDLEALVPAKSYPSYQVAEEELLKGLTESLGIS